ncbi:transposable element Tcb2 transposase [Trichonephila clavipes]|uniref:Transposable element Tcb2 transposase n=1 Tax=Trichonephila clavipes TaxID=2585209 RepID=A0A8X6RMU7_TRICX|nr:transposable element Tcb2 transposase [Trichonephila clavipes]
MEGAEKWEVPDFPQGVLPQNWGRYKQIVLSPVWHSKLSLTIGVQPIIPLRRRRSHYQQLTDFERGRIIELREGGFSFRYVTERLGRNVSIAHYCWEQWWDDTVSRRPSSRWPRGITEREDRRIRRAAVAHHIASVAENGATAGTTVVTNSRAHWRTEWRFAVFSDENRFCLGASDGSVLIRRRSRECLQPNCLRPRYTEPTPGLGSNFLYDRRSTLVFIPNTLTSNLYVSLVIQPFVLQFMSNIHGKVFQQDNARLHTAVVMQRALQSVEMLPWPARSPDLSPIENV